MRRNYKEQKVEAINLQNYLSRRNITLESLVRKRKLDTHEKINEFLSKIGVEKQDKKFLNKVLKNISKSETSKVLNQEASNNIVSSESTQKQNRSQRRKTRSTKLTNIVNIENVESNVDNVPENLSTDSNE